MKRAHEEEKIKDTNTLILPSPHDHYIMWLAFMICPEWPREIVIHQIMPQFCDQENVLYSYLAKSDSMFFRHLRPPQNMWSFFNVYYTPLIELPDRGYGITICGEGDTMSMYVHSDLMTVDIHDSTGKSRVYEITEDMTYYALCRKVY